MIRPPAITVRFAVVTAAIGVLAGGAVATGGAALSGRVYAGEPATATPSDPVSDLRLAERVAAPVAERLAAARRLADTLAAGTAASRVPAPAPVVEPDPVLRAAASLVAEDPSVAGRLALAALDAGYARKDARDSLAGAAQRAAAASAPAPDAARRQDLEALLLLVGVRGRGESLLRHAPPTALARAVVARDAPEIALAGDALPAIDAWRAHEEIATLLDAAAEDDPKTAEPALDALKAAGSRALPLLIATAKPAGGATPPGLVGRRVRAVVVLGAIGDRAAVPALLECLGDDVARHEDGWVRAAAVEALGDLRDPRAIGPLCRILFYQGDIHRPYDAWEYPGSLFTTVSVADWPAVEYHAIDSAACNALLRLGVRGGAEWLITERLDPRSGRWRIRVTQDGIDAIRRAFPDAPKGYEPDAGYPQRQRGVEELLAWWHARPRLPREIDEAAPENRAALDAIASRVGGPGVKVMELQIVKRAAALIGAALTPSLIDALKGASTTKFKTQRAEIAAVLGTVRDRRAVPVLFALTREDPSDSVRANAAESLGVYADPEFPALVVGPQDVSCAAIVARLLEMLDDPGSAPRASAMKALASVPPHPSIVAALDAHVPEKHPENDFEDYRLAEQVVRLVQTGGDVGGVLVLLDDPVLVRRRFVWELLRSALRLDARAFDPTPDPDAVARKTLDKTATAAALERRRSEGCR